METKLSMLVFSDRYPDGQLMRNLEARREYIRAKFKKEHVTMIEVSDDFALELNEVLEELN